MYYISSFLALALALVATVQAAPSKKKFSCSNLTSGALQLYKHGHPYDTHNVHTHKQGGYLLSKSTIDTWVTFTACNNFEKGSGNGNKKSTNSNNVYYGQVKSNGMCFTRQVVGNGGSNQNLVLKECEDVNSWSGELKNQWFQGQYINNLLRLVPTDGEGNMWPNEWIDSNWHNVLNFYGGDVDSSNYGLGLNEEP
ncbi:hypothetical protein MSPP1_003764 [Malassezia sp. CBS 17886]|nr:hypothetical protein MSPP1_001607 [Malassezia sp. CBS 17886]WFD32714.1 hypothetical protein MSPP1_003764 [Malassezia sp. CBS 17886]